MVETKTSSSNRAWLEGLGYLKLMRYLRRYHKKEDRDTVFNLIYEQYPDEGRKLVENFDLTNKNKFNMFLDWIINSPALVCGIYGDERMGKDASVCYIFDEVIKLLNLQGLRLPRIVTLGNIRKPPFVKEEDMYFSFQNIPTGTKDNEIWIYCSEIELVIPAREGSSQENKLFNQLHGTFAQNHQKLFGCAKLAAKIDINFIRACNCKIFKFISPEKLNIEGVERDQILSGLGRWLLPSNNQDQSKVLLAFNNQLFTMDFPLPDWWSDDYSEQFRDIPIEKIWEYVEVQFSNGLTVSEIITAVKQKFRQNLTAVNICNHLGIKLTLRSRM